VRLLLFDIDGTLLLRASTEHALAMHEALRRVHGIEIPEGRIEAAGRTDGAIARSILTLAGISADRIDRRAADVRIAACEAFAGLCPESLEEKVAPGMSALVGELAQRDDVRMSLVTGNYEPVARLKLKRAGIGHAFPAGQGAFGSDSEDRAELPAIARARAGGDGTPFPRERTIVIGDTPRDIACARADGVHVIGIATGPYGAHELDGADAVVGHAGELAGAIDALVPATRA
jgi:phosphoglycolate phosphatase